MIRVAVLSVHTCPLAALGGKETGGMNVYVRDSSQMMGRSGLQVDVFTRSQNPHISPIVRLSQNVRVIHLKAGPEEPIPKEKLLQILPEFTVGVVQFAEKKRISYDLIHSHYWLSGWVGGQLKHKWAIPLVHMFHTLGMLKNDMTRHKEKLEPRGRLIVEDQIMDFADGIIAPSPWEKEQMVVRYGADPLKIKVIPCGVNLNLFKPIPSARAKKLLGLQEKRFILFVGRIDAIKGIDVLIQAMEALIQSSQGGPNLGLIIIGGEQDADRQSQNREMKRLRRLVAEKGLQDRVAFWGSQRQDLLPRFYSAAEALVLPSRYESFGMVALEAMACGTPVIASRVGGLQFTVEDGKTGFVIPDGDWRLLAERIREVIGSPSLKRKLVRQAMAKVKKFSWAVITKRILLFYGSLLGPKRQELIRNSKARTLH